MTKRILNAAQSGNAIALNEAIAKGSFKVRTYRYRTLANLLPEMLVIMIEAGLVSDVQNVDPAKFVSPPLIHMFKRFYKHNPTKVREILEMLLIHNNMEGVEHMWNKAVVKTAFIEVFGRRPSRALYQWLTAKNIQPKFDENFDVGWLANWHTVSSLNLPSNNLYTLRFQEKGLALMYLQFARIPGTQKFSNADSVYFHYETLEGPIFIDEFGEAIEVENHHQSHLFRPSNGVKCMKCRDKGNGSSNEVISWLKFGMVDMHGIDTHKLYTEVSSINYEAAIASAIHCDNLVALKMLIGDCPGFDFIPYLFSRAYNSCIEFLLQKIKSPNSIRRLVAFAEKRQAGCPWFAKVCQQIRLYTGTTDLDKYANAPEPTNADIVCDVAPSKLIRGFAE